MHLANRGRYNSAMSTPSPSSFLRTLLILSALLLRAPAPTAAAEPKTQERWYVLQIEGKPAGWARETHAESSDGKEITTGSEMQLAMKRGTTRINMTMKSSFRETADGKPIEAKSSALFGATKIDQTFTFQGDKIEITSEQSGQTLKNTADAPKEKWLTPAAASRYVEEQLKKGAKSIEMKTLEPMSGLAPLHVTMTIVGKEDIEVLGKTVPALVCESTVSSLPGVVSKMHIGEDGSNLRTTLAPIPGMTFTMLLADKDLAQAQVDPPEMLAATLIEVPKPIDQPRKLQSAVYELKFKPAGDKAAPRPGAGRETIELPKAGFQRVIWGDDRTAKVIVDLTQPVPPGDDLPKQEHRTPSATLNSDDPKIKELVAKALKDQPATLPAKAKAELLRKFVSTYIKKKNLSVGFATASEVARTKQGDCTEHGVLLAAMLRAAGIPSRTASGLIYADAFIEKKNIFAYHMWAQAWLEPDKDAKAQVSGGYWMDIDATLEDWPYDAAHITLGVSAMADDEKTNDMVRLVPIIGRLELKVISTQVGK